MKQREDKVFDEIILKDIKVKIAEAFLDLEVSIRVREQNTVPAGIWAKELIEKKANQMKDELNSFIDSQVVRIIGFSGNQVQIENQGIE